MREKIEPKIDLPVGGSYQFTHIFLYYGSYSNILLVCLRFNFDNMIIKVYIDFAFKIYVRFLSGERGRQRKVLKT